MAFLFSCSGHHRDGHSFPTRLSSDLLRQRAARERHPSHVARGIVIGAPLPRAAVDDQLPTGARVDRKSTRLNSSHTVNSYAVFCLKKNSYLEAVRQRGPPVLDGAVDY